MSKTPILRSISEIHPFTDEQLDFFNSVLKADTIKKGGFLLKPGQVCNSITYVSSGSFRYYKEVDDTDMTLHFFTENSWVADAESFFSQKPAQNYIVAAEATEILQFSIYDLHTLMDKHPPFKMLGTMMGSWIISTNHHMSIKLKNPDERYKELFATHPEWINRFPQNQIASYLGMTPETLSRVRSRMI